VKPPPKTNVVTTKTLEHASFAALSNGKGCCLSCAWGLANKIKKDVFSMEMEWQKFAECAHGSYEYCQMTSLAATVTKEQLT